MLSQIISKQLNAYPKFKKQARIGYFSSIPLQSAHMDTMFWHVSGEDNGVKIPILVIVDVATRFTRYFIQTSKNDSIKGFLEEFIEDVKSKWPEQHADTMILITDGAHELAVKGDVAGVDVIHKLSTGINKAVLAEVAIRKARAILRTVEAHININNIMEKVDQHIDHSNIKQIFSAVETQINAKAKLRKPKPQPPYTPPRFNIGDAVFALNFLKFYPHQMKDQMTKSSYKQNYYYEPFKVTRVILINGVYKYSLASFVDTSDNLKYYFYEDQLQEIVKRFVLDYISAYLQKHRADSPPHKK